MENDLRNLDWGEGMNQALSADLKVDIAGNQAQLTLELLKALDRKKAKN